MTEFIRTTRREMLAQTSAIALWGGLAGSAHPAPPQPPAAKKVAAVITEYQTKSHADVLIGKILEGWKQDRGTGPALTLASMYLDQFPANDLARPLAAKYNIPLFDTIEQALTLGGDQIAVDGVISIGEHGDYPWNDKGQHLYPRRRFFEQITDAFDKHGRVVPVFNDKHLGPEWADALWMYERAREMKVPFMAGSSLPLSFRDPDISVPLGSEIEGAVGIGYDGLDIYGFHALEAYQSLVERRKGAEQGVEWVQCLQGAAMWKAIDGGLIDSKLIAAAMHALSRQIDDDLRCDEQSALFLFKYLDGFLGSVLMLPTTIGGTAVALKIKGQPKLIAMRFEERPDPHHPHFAYLLKAIERMMHTGRSSYPVERTLLTGGILDRALTSLADGQKRLQTPELAIAYTPADYPHAPHPDLNSAPTEGRSGD